MTPSTSPGAPSILSTVCAIHLGMAEGISELTGGDLTVDELVPHDPRSANCRLRLHRRAQTGGGAA